MNQPYPASDLSSWQPIHGWPMQLIALVEAEQPGRLWRLMHASPARRQAIFAALASLHESPSDLSTGVLRRLLDDGLKLAPRDLLERSFGSCPDGLVGALGKLGFEPLATHRYRQLLDLFEGSAPDQLIRAQAIRQMAHLDDGIIEAALTLDSDLVSPRVLMKVPNGRVAEKTNAQARLIRQVCTGETSLTLRTAISADEDRGWPGWFSKKLERADTPFPHDLPTNGDPEFERVSPKNAQRIGSEFKNCLGRSERFLHRLLSGSFCMVAYRGEPTCIIELVKCEGEGWIAPRIHLPNNAAIRREAMVAIQQRLAPLGVRLLIPAEPPKEMALIKDQPVFCSNLMEMIDLD